jgi:uncharacterized membrane protein
MTEARLRRAALVLAVAGLGVAAYLTYVHYADVKPLCTIAHGCVKVQTSRYAKLAGVPVALLGLIGYALLLASLWVPGERGLIAGALIALGGFGFSAYLTYREVFTIRAICQWCVISAILMALLALVTMTRLLRYPT